MKILNTELLDSSIISKLRSDNEITSYIGNLFEQFKGYKPDFFEIIENDLRIIIHNQRERLKSIEENPDNVNGKYFDFLNNIQLNLDSLVESVLELKTKFYNNKDAKDIMYEYIKAEFHSRLEGSSDEKQCIEYELKLLKEFEERANILTEIYRNDTILDDYQIQYENKYGNHRNEFEYLRIISGYYHYKEREKKKTFFYLPTLVKHVIFKKYLLKLYENYNITSKQIGIKGFQSSLSDGQIESLYNQMQGRYFRTTLENFKVLFKNETLPSKFKPILWLKPFSVVLCAYFISELFQSENPYDYWRIGEYCFNTKNLKQALNNAIQYNPDGKPKGYENIDTILKNIYPPLQ